MRLLQGGSRLLRLHEHAEAAQVDPQERLCFTTWQSNHHLHLVRTDGESDDECAERVRSFQRLANSLIAKEVQKLCAGAGHPWQGGILGTQRASITEVTDEPEAQIA